MSNLDDLAAFLREQVNEDDRRNPWPWWAKGQIRQPKRRARVSREITAKRWIIDWATSSSASDQDKQSVLAPLGYIYSTRPGYRQEWRP